jgi:hypothetical protein
MLAGVYERSVSTHPSLACYFQMGVRAWRHTTCRRKLPTLVAKKYVDTNDAIQTPNRAIRSGRDTNLGEPASLERHAARGNGFYAPTCYPSIEEARCFYPAAGAL